MSKQTKSMLILSIFLIVMGFLYFMHERQGGLADASKAPKPEIVNKYCGGNSPLRGTMLKSADGTIGGYVIRHSVTDSPIDYLDADGKFLTTFYIFDPDEKKNKASAVIEELTKKFPVEEALCKV